ncbi:hypothetical protein [Streptomyces sp. NPDC001480]|uniref:hypothetical protein n=1 Tax=Streptomyces sp. NPDC001480 TaxID=3364577 RepID=UPI0036B1F3DB
MTARTVPETAPLSAATMVAAESYPNPREVTANGVLGLLTSAYEGREPRSEVLQ